ncbi:MAG: hypothetical protein ABJR05_01880 [Balneola sp.]
MGTSTGSGTFDLKVEVDDGYETNSSSEHRVTVADSGCPPTEICF